MVVANSSVSLRQARSRTIRAGQYSISSKRNEILSILGGLAVGRARHISYPIRNRQSELRTLLLIAVAKHGR
jgi:hypothetical protein